MKEELYKIKSYIENSYNISIEELKDEFYDHALLIRVKKYDLIISLEEPSIEHFLNGKCKYVLNFDYEANKKYRSELCCHGGGYADIYSEHDYSNIEKFLDEYCIRKSKKQLSIFDI